MPVLSPAIPRGSLSSEVEKRLHTGGFKSLGHFAMAVQRRKYSDQARDALVEWGSIQSKAPQGLFGDSDPDGGDLIPRGFADRIFERMSRPTELLPYLDPLPLSGRSLEFPVAKEDSRADGSRHGGMQGYWEGEGDQHTKSKPQFRNVQLYLHKLIVMTYVTEELLMDSGLLEAHLLRLAPKELNFKINDALVNGSGAGIPLGFLKSNSRITATAVSGQGANTIVADNILSMFSRVVPGQRSGMVWLYSPSAELELMRLKVPTGYSIANSRIIDFADDGSLRICGRPGLRIEQCAALGTEGDLIALAPDGICCAVSRAGIEQYMSIHLRFDYDEDVFKWRIRLDAQPFDDVALTPFAGTPTFSSIVTLSSTRT